MPIEPYVHALIALVAVSDPLSKVRLFEGIVGESPKAQRIRACNAVAAGILLVLSFAALLGVLLGRLFAGDWAGTITGLGGLIMSMVGIRMLGMRYTLPASGTLGPNHLMVPFCFPLFVGPAAMITSAALAASLGTQGLEVLGAALLSFAAAAWLMLYRGPLLAEHATPNLTRSITRIAGMTLAVLGFVLGMSGIRTLPLERYGRDRPAAEQLPDLPEPP